MLSALGFKGTIVTLCEKYNTAASPAGVSPLPLPSPLPSPHQQLSRTQIFKEAPGLFLTLFFFFFF